MQSREKLFGLNSRGTRLPVPVPVVVYAVLGVLDFGFTLMAFQLGFMEGNPLLNWYAEKGLFEVAKVGFTLAVIILGFLLWDFRIVRAIIYIANVLMVGVVLFHIYNLLAIIFA